jgi:DNA-directed RNA polymerase sigma subunit (sigma70/sigma32)
MSSFLWPNDEGWPYPDTGREEEDLSDEYDDDALSIRAPAHMFDSLDTLERAVIRGRYGLDGAPERSLKQLQSDLGVPRTELRDALGSGLSKLRSQLL